MAEIKIPEEIMKKYLEEREKSTIILIKYERLGSGWHGTGYKIRYEAEGKKKDVILRTLRPVGFSHDFASDRAKVFILQHELSNGIPDHIKSLDVGGYTEDGNLVSLGDIKEYFQVVEVADGDTYVDDLLRILKSKKLEDEDIKKAKLLSNYLVTLHNKRFEGTDEMIASLRRRHSRDALGHGEMLIGVVDTYPKKKWITDKKLTELICKTAAFREKVKDTSFIPRRMHGDFHPANVMFKGLHYKVLDASREIFGDPADDVTTMAINYIWYAVQQTGKFDGPFKELFDIYWKNYFDKTKDKLIVKTAALYFAFRSVVVVHPVFFKDQSNNVRNKILKFASNILDDTSFKSTKINDYLR